MMDVEKIHARHERAKTILDSVVRKSKHEEHKPKHEEEDHILSDVLGALIVDALYTIAEQQAELASYFREIPIVAYSVKEIKK